MHLTSSDAGVLGTFSQTCPRYTHGSHSTRRAPTRHSPGRQGRGKQVALRGTNSANSASPAGVFPSQLFIPGIKVTIMLDPICLHAQYAYWTSSMHIGFFEVQYAYWTSTTCPVCILDFNKSSMHTGHASMHIDYASMHTGVFPLEQGNPICKLWPICILGMFIVHIGHETENPMC